jgi:nitrate/TMAO reductase-like tetraheme cytochrome c subunit
MAAGLVKKIEEKIMSLSSKAKIVILVVLAVMVIGGSVVAYFMWDYTQNNPKFCVTCHLMQPAFDSWEQSAHKALNCHDCHHLTLIEQNMLLVNFVVKRPASVPARHGHQIVPSKFCVECHIDGKENRGKAPLIKASAFHVKHQEKGLECTQCHGTVDEKHEGLHRFLPKETFCLNCHKDRQVHGVGMGELACLNCHTDRTKNLLPSRKKCLFCHSADEAIRKELIAEGAMDVKHFMPDQSVIKKATKIKYPEQAPMQINCYECHQPHVKGKARPNSEACLRCHAKVKTSGKHEMHLGMDMKCKDCHKPHVWKVTDADAKKTCVKCHAYRSPKAFLAN